MEDKKVVEHSYKDTKKQGTSNNTDDKAKSPYSSDDHERATNRWITVEPVVSLIAIALGIYVAVQPQLMRDILAAARGITWPKTSGNFCGPRNNSHPYVILLTEIQADVSYWQMITNLCGALPSLLMSPLLGACSDKVGRKAILGLATLGYVVTVSTVLIVFYFDLPIWVLPIGSFFQGLTGGHGIIIAGCAAYITDITTKQYRMLRMAIMHGCFVASIALPQLLIGFLIEEVGFGPALWISLICLIVCLLYVFVPRCLLETIDKQRWRQEVGNTRSRFQGLVDVFRDKIGYRRIRLALLFTAECLDEMLNANSVTMIIIYGLGPPFCWSPVVVSGFLALVLFASAFGR